ncbi:ABC transporter permease [Membranihabitans marinus]|uniref:ABC transporter permease n=1 Tax=Membranihabitans marinus TaxID=1227546 RepID=UPI001F025F9F|nr:ABC transporter permease subunit [Membranihabitans marinus]
MKDWIGRHIEVVILGLFLFICYIGSSFLANENAILAKCDGEYQFFHKENTGECTVLWHPLLVKMDGETIRPEVASYARPLSRSPQVGIHLLGTDGLGRDVMAGLLYGGRKSITIGLLTALLAIVLGWSIGLVIVFLSKLGMANYHYWSIIGLIIVFVMSFFLEIYHLFILMALLAGLIYIFFVSRPSAKRIRVGWLLSRGVEWYQALPDLLILLVLSASLKLTNEWTLILIMVLISWPGFAMMARREGLEIMEKPYFKQALRNGVKYQWLFLNYLFKNSVHLFLAVLPLSIARFILLETTLSFLGLGLPPDRVTLGTLLNQAKDYLDGWWVFVFSGLFIFILLFFLQRLGYKLLSFNSVTGQ